MAVKVGIVGCMGRMGVELVKASLSNEGTGLTAGVVRGGAAFQLEGVGEQFRYCSSIEELFDVSDVVIDFTAPECMKQCLELARDKGTALVSGTTGHDLHGLMLDVASKVPVLWASNMSYGIVVANKLVEQAAAMLKGYDIEVYEMHHRHKKDAISGTAMTLAEHAAKGSGAQLEQGAVRGPKDNKKINFLVSRGGGVPGDHSVTFADEDQLVTISHRSISRSVFAKGAVKAALWLHAASQEGAALRLFSMSDVASG